MAKQNTNAAGMSGEENQNYSNGAETAEQETGLELSNKSDESLQRPERPVVNNIIMTESRELVEATDSMLDHLNDPNLIAFEITGEYKEWEQGENMKCIFSGWTEIDNQFGAEASVNKNGKIDCARLMTKENGIVKTYISADTVVVSSLKQFIAPKLVEITCTGKEKSKKGSYKTFKVSLLV